MVNVAGRSKGCATCRRRKVKCDLTLPQCRRCLDMGLACPGPRTGSFFVHAVWADPAASRDASPAKSTIATAPGKPQLEELKAAFQIPPTRALQSCRASAFDQLFTSHFIESFGLKQANFSTPRTATWLDRLPLFMELKGDHQVKSSIRSTSMLSYGTWARDVAIQTEAYRWYTKALMDLRGRMTLRTTTAVENAACAAVMLIHFETWAGTSGGAWLQHVNGAASIIEAAGPSVCRHGFMQHIFVHLRFQTCIVALHENRQHIFAMPEWLSVPFSVTPKTLFDRLVDIFFSVQRCLVVAREVIRLDRAEDDATWRTLLRTLVQETLALLAAWALEGFHDSASHSDAPAPLKSIPDSSVSQCWSRRQLMNFANVPEAALTALFHAASLIIARLSLLANFDDPHPSKSPIQHASIVLEANAFVGRDTGPTSRLGPIMMLPQLKIVSIWAPVDEEREAARNLLRAEANRTVAFAEMVESRSGYFASVGEYVRELQ